MSVSPFQITHRFVDGKMVIACGSGVRCFCVQKSIMQVWILVCKFSPGGLSSYHKNIHRPLHIKFSSISTAGTPGAIPN
ncbi:unnamed protein product [Larinioides sclopetarius]|uniref:Uncharacterized protein n=1 Tax=Larinioides sclopetarius TaxID=280406 RepID=A0AAV1ZIQ6_9ARAC